MVRGNTTTTTTTAVNGGSRKKGILFLVASSAALLLLATTDASASSSSVECSTEIQECVQDAACLSCAQSAQAGSTTVDATDCAARYPGAFSSASLTTSSASPSTAAPDCAVTGATICCAFEDTAEATECMTIDGMVKLLSCQIETISSSCSVEDLPCYADALLAAASRTPAPASPGTTAAPSSPGTTAAPSAPPSEAAGGTAAANGAFDSTVSSSTVAIATAVGVLVAGTGLLVQ